MAQTLTADICVIGGGPAGLAAASLAASYGVQTILIEKKALGGTSLYSGCVPSKALLAAANAAQAVREARAFGIKADEPEIDYKAIAAHIQEAIAAAQRNTTPERYNALGIDIIASEARFTAPDTVATTNYTISARRFIIATGSTPTIPIIPGLDRIPFWTADTIFAAAKRFQHLLIVGGDSTALELAQACVRLNSNVTVIDADKLLPRDDAELRSHLLQRLREEGVRILENARLERIETFGAGLQVIFSTQGRSYSVDCSDIMLSLPRTPAIDRLNLDAAGIAYSEKGILVSRRLRTTNKRVYAIGDVTGELPYAHTARYHASLAVRDALFYLPVRARHETIPWVTLTQPELSHVGLTEEEARSRYGKLTVMRAPYAENDRAQAERKASGFVKVIASRGGKVLGAGAVGASAGEIVQMWSLAMQKGITLSAMSKPVLPHPTLNEINKSLASSFVAPRAEDPLARKIIGMLAKIG
jgi:pyruvate/2-oxoglutarate dehydrogenase complex dihydrolipoamide dehydrogenase (E3) component